MRTLSLLLIAFFVSLGSQKALAAVPNPPTEFNTGYVQISGTELFTVKLMWNGSTSDDTSKKALGYLIYMADTATEDESMFRLIDTVTEPYSGNTFRYMLERLGAGTYTFFIRAYNNYGVSSRTAIKVVKLVVKNTSASLRFITEPGKTVNRGGTYVYESKAVCTDSSKNSHIRYKIISGPDGMTIDSITGRITWTAPNVNKTVTVKILAYLDNDDSIKADQSWTITVGEGNNNNEGEGCALFFGSVKDTSGNEMNGTVKIFRIDSNGRLMDGVYMVNVVNGRWTRRLPAGTYVLRTQGENFEYEYYNDAKEPAQAERFTIECNDTIEVNFEVTPLPKEQKFVFQGRITDSQSNSGLQGTVYFYPIVNGALGTPIVVKTNAEGYYEVALSGRYNYYAKAMSGDDFLPLWFENASSSTTATVLVADGNKNNINFALPHRQSYNNGFSGQLIDSAAHGVPGRVVAFLIATKNNEKYLQTIRSVETDASGNFTINNLTPGDYVLQGVPNSRPFVPGYYRANEYSVFKWANATTLSLDSTTKTNGLAIKLRAGEGRRGIIKLKGRVDGDKQITKGQDNQIQNVNALSGALIVVLDNNNVPVDYAFSGADGSYEVNELALGSNTVIVDRPGYTSSTQNMNFSGSSFVVSNDVKLQALVASVSEEAISNSLISPNPASSSVSLSFESAGGLASISIVNSLGMELSSGTQNLVNGQNTVILDASRLDAGTYFVRISQQQKVSVLKFSVIR